MTKSMSEHLPHFVVPRVGDDWDASANPTEWSWDESAPLPPFILADGSGPAIQQTATHLCYNSQKLFVRFDCDDRDIWGVSTKRDDPIYDEEVVEVFIGPGESTLVDYYEFEVSPNGVLLDLSVHNPTSQRSQMKTDFSWNCPGLRWAAGRDDALNHWWAIFAIPWASIGAHRAQVDLGAPSPNWREMPISPKVWRANFYRIERPRDGEPEFSCWSATMTDPADYHKPAYFGYLELG